MIKDIKENSRLVVVINYNKKVSLETVECLQLITQQDYVAAVIRIYQTLESPTTNSDKPELIIVAPTGSLSNWLGWTRPLKEVWFIDYKASPDLQPLEEVLSFLDKSAEIDLAKVEPKRELPVSNGGNEKKSSDNKDRAPTHHRIHVNPFVGFLSTYNTNGAGHANAYEEYQKGMVANPLNIETKTQKYLLGLFSKENLKAGKTPSVILTGNAGDGKTRLCRLVWESLSNRNFSTAGQSLEDSVIDLSEECHCKVKIVKDLSDWTEQMGVEILKQLVHGKDETGIHTVFLIAANEGRLRWALHADPVLSELRKEVEEVLNGLPQPSKTVVLNLNQISTSNYILRLIDRMTTHDEWKKCESCPAISFCPIKWNRDQLTTSPNGEASLPAKRLTELYKVVEQLGRHITFRDALIHLSYTLIGRLNCYSVQAVPEEQRPHFARWVYYKNCYGDEADTSFQHTGVFGHLRGFDVASNSNFHIDQLIINGNFTANQSLKTSWYEVFKEGVDLGGEKKLFTNARLSYLNKELKTSSRPVKNKTELLFDLMKWWLPHARRKFFFEWPEIGNKEALLYSPYSLIPFKSYSTMQRLLFQVKDEGFFSEQVKYLVKALNRIFSELFLKYEEVLYLSSRTGFTTRIPVPVIRNKFFTDKLVFERENIEPITAECLEREPNRFILTVPTPNGNIPLYINLLLFEYLWRVQAGSTLDYLREECGLAIEKFQEKLLVASSGANQISNLKIFNYVNNNFIIQKLTLKDGQKLSISKE